MSNPSIVDDLRWELFWGECEAMLGAWADALVGNVIPPWCTGIDPAFWETKPGKKLADLLWFIHQDDAMLLPDAARLLYGAARWINLERLQRRLIVYPITPAARKRFRRRGAPRYYVLRSQVMALKAMAGPPVLPPARYPPRHPRRSGPGAGATPAETQTD